MDSSNARLTGTRGLRRYTHRDYPMVKEWYERRGKRMPEPATLSDLGYIADNRVVGFLYLTNSNMAMIEGIVANPESVPSLRRESLNKLVGYMIDTALLLGYENIFGISKHPSMEEIAGKYGFKTSEYKVYTLSDSTNEISTDVHYEEDEEY